MEFVYSKNSTFNKLFCTQKKIRYVDQTQLILLLLARAANKKFQRTPHYRCFSSKKRIFFKLAFNATMNYPGRGVAKTVLDLLLIAGVHYFGCCGFNVALINLIRLIPCNSVGTKSLKRGQCGTELGCFEDVLRVF